MKGDTNGCSTTKNGEERYDYFTARGRKMLQYDYRTPDGKLFSCVTLTLEAARAKRDRWMTEVSNG